MRHRIGEFDCEIPLIISNHEDLRAFAEGFSVPYYVFPITKENKQQQELKEIELLKEHDIDLIVIARYMQVLSSTMIDAFPQQIINIHHSTLPAFKGAKPYHQAYERGVKLIGATAHYVTTDLDEGPIIEQRVERVIGLPQRGKDGFSAHGLLCIAHQWIPPRANL